LWFNVGDNAITVKWSFCNAVPFTAVVLRQWTLFEEPPVLDRFAAAFPLPVKTEALRYQRPGTPPGCPAVSARMKAGLHRFPAGRRVGILADAARLFSVTRKTSLLSAAAKIGLSAGL